MNPQHLLSEARRLLGLAVLHHPGALELDDATRKILEAVARLDEARDLISKPGLSGPRSSSHPCIQPRTGRVVTRDEGRAVSLGGGA